MSGLFPRPQLLAVLALLLAAVVISYAPFLPLPAISDDFIQIGLGREFLRADGFAHLADHPLYRTRATSIFLTRGLDLLFGADILPHRAASLLLHVLNGVLVFALGVWPRIGYRRSFAAALVFVVVAGHQEAVVWVAAVHELLVFAFTAICGIAWLQWLRLRESKWLALVAIAFFLALYSKESAAVIPALLGGLWLAEGERRRIDWIPIVLSGIAVLGYTWAVFAASRTHQHLNDGTFSLHAPFVMNLLRTLWRLDWPWGLGAAAILLSLRQPWPVAIATLYSAIALLPYSFLTYMPFAPSRHTYLATAGLALLLGFAWAALTETASGAKRKLAIGGAIVFFLFNPAYLWWKKLPQYAWRARPTEAFLAFAREHGKPVFVGPTPYSVWVYRYTAFVSLGWRHEDVISVGEKDPPEGTPVFTHPLEPKRGQP